MRCVGYVPGGAGRRSLGREIRRSLDGAGRRSSGGAGRRNSGGAGRRSSGGVGRRSSASSPIRPVPSRAIHVAGGHVYTVGFRKALR